MKRISFFVNGVNKFVNRSVFPAKAEDFHLVFRTTNNNVLDDTSIVRTLEKFVIHPHYNIRTQKVSL